jgi:hypothetical protein
MMSVEPRNNNGCNIVPPNRRSQTQSSWFPTSPGRKMWQLAGWRPLVCVALVTLCAPFESRADVTLESLLREMTNTEALARWPVPEFTCKQASSYDRQKVAPDKPGWFANGDHTQYIRTEENKGRREQVMMEADGPGAIVRFWLTTGNQKNGVLRVYLDGSPTPALIYPEYDLLSGELNPGEPLLQAHPGYDPKGGGGNNLYLPIPYAKHCKVTWEEKSSNPRYYQINYRTYAPGTEVTTFAMDQVTADKHLIAGVNQALADPPGSVEGGVSSMSQGIAPGSEAVLDLPAGPGAIRSLELQLEPDGSVELERTLRSIIVQLTFDGEVTAWCPATDFFGSGVGLNELHSWYRTVSPDGKMRCRWVMPYEKAGRITLINVGRQPVNATLHAVASSWNWDDRSMHFHAAWHYEACLKVPPFRDWNYVRIAGRGVYAGDSLAVYNPEPAWYGEGDEKIWVDGEAFPSDMGTGTEDYYDYSWAPKPVSQRPFNNLVREDQVMTQGWNVMSRTRNLDEVPFRKSLQFDMELIPWRSGSLIYCATTYWYAFPGAIANIKPQPQAAALPIPTLADARAQVAANSPRKPGAIECETMKLLGKSSDFTAEPQDMDPWGRERWSGGCQLLVKPNQAGDFIELAVPAPDGRAKELVLYATKAPDYGVLNFMVNGQPSKALFDGYSDKVEPAAPLQLGTFTPDNGRFILRVKVVGANPQSSGAKYLFGLDCVVLEAVPDAQKSP